MKLTRFYFPFAMSRLSSAFTLAVLSAMLSGMPIIIGTQEAVAGRVHAIAMHATPKQGRNFTHFDYVNPDAPKGGRLTLAEHGSFDSLNPLIIKGVPAAGLRDFLFESLLARGRDEPFTLYAQIAQFIEIPDDRRSITFHINRKARFSDGLPIDADDIIFSWKVLRDHGRPNHRAYYAKVKRVERLSDHSLTFHFDQSEDRELPLILGLMPVLPSHLLTEESFERTTLTPPVGSGPYIITKVDPGRSLTYTRDKNWWGRDLPINRGRFNFNEIRFDYYRDSSAMFEAFKSGNADLRYEQDPARWAEGYNIEAVHRGLIHKATFNIELPAGMMALTFNTRRDVFKDQNVRKALIHMFDFEWINKNLYHSLYARTQSYFERSKLSSTGKPADEIERRLLAPYLKNISPQILEGNYTFPKNDGSGHNRTRWKMALALLKKAGYELRGGKMRRKDTNKPLVFEMLASSPSQQRLFLSYSRQLKRIGVDAKIRVVDSAQYQSRLKDYDYDMIQSRWRSSLSPGNEQLFRWSSDMVERPGSYNFAGVANKAADAMIQAMLQAKSSQDFTSAVRALDRVLLSGDYVIPLFHLKNQWLAYWDHLKHPDKTPVFGYQLDTWWNAPNDKDKAHASHLSSARRTAK